MICSGAGAAGQSGSGDAGEIIVDTSGSMGADGVRAAYAAQTALDQILDGVWFAMISENDRAQLVFPPSPEPVMVKMDQFTRQAAKEAVSRFYADGGTAMGTCCGWPSRVFATVPSLTQKHAILLTDGENQHETPAVLTQTIEAVTGQFRDCRVGVPAGRRGTADRDRAARDGRHHPGPGPAGGRVLQADPERDEPRCRAGRSVRAAGCGGAVRPPGRPTVEDLTSRRTAVNAQLQLVPDRLVG